MSQMNMKLAFSSEKEAIDHFIQVRYKGVITCPRCGATTNIYRRRDNPKNYQCKTCNCSISVFKDTIFEKTKTDIRIWFDACKSLINDVKGMPALLFEKKVFSDYGIKISYKCIWRMFKKIRKAMLNETQRKLIDITVEIDETYVGPKPRRIRGVHNKRGRGTSKTPVLGIYDRLTGRVHMTILPREKNAKYVSSKQIEEQIKKYCNKGITINTDEFKGYKFLDNISSGYFHNKVNHSKQEYSKGNGIHTNNIERSWSLLKRGGLYKRYHVIKPENLMLYINEYCFRQNNPHIQKAFKTILEQSVIRKSEKTPGFIKAAMKYSNYRRFDSPLYMNFGDFVETDYIFDRYTRKYISYKQDGHVLYILERYKEKEDLCERWHFFKDFSNDAAMDFLQIFDEEVQQTAA